MKHCVSAPCCNAYDRYDPRFDIGLLRPFVRAHLAPGRSHTSDYAKFYSCTGPKNLLHMKTASEPIEAGTIHPSPATTTPLAALPARVAWQEPVLAWFLSRLVCIVAIILGSALFPIERKIQLRGKDSPNAGVHSNIAGFFQAYAKGFRDLERFGTKPMIGVSVGGQEAWLRPFVHWDAVWWQSIAEVGYVADPKLKAEQNVVFYPLFPLCIRAVHMLGVPPVLAGMLIVNGLMLVVTCLLYRFMVRRSGVPAARWTLALWLTFPSAFFGVVPYSEALLALLSFLVMQGVLEQKYTSSGLWSGLASAIKNQGVIIGGALIVPLLMGPRRGRAFIGLLCSGLGLLSYMGFLYYQYGDPLLFVTIQM